MFESLVLRGFGAFAPIEPFCRYATKVFERMVDK